MSGSRVMKKAVNNNINNNQMSDSTVMKRAQDNNMNNNNGRHCETTIESLPTDLLFEIIAKVASDSLIDLLNLKLCSKNISEITQHDYIYQQVSLEIFPLFPWSSITPQESHFLKHCRECCNLDSLFREAMVQYFSDIEFKLEGLQTLQVAAQKGHNEAMYVIAMVLLSIILGKQEDDDTLLAEQKKDHISQVIEYLRFLRKNKCIMKCRNRIRDCMGEMWINNRVIVGEKKFLCNSKTCKGWRIKEGEWMFLDDEDDENDANMCENCRWDDELLFFYDLLNV